MAVLGTVKEGAVDFFNSFENPGHSHDGIKARAGSQPTSRKRLQTLQVVRLTRFTRGLSRLRRSIAGGGGASGPGGGLAGF
jgi:hypothetical protein